MQMEYARWGPNFISETLQFLSESLSACHGFEFDSETTARVRFRLNSLTALVGAAEIYIKVCLALFSRPMLTVVPCLLSTYLWPTHAKTIP